jgi:adenylate cyclase, class 2
MAIEIEKKYRLSKEQYDETISALREFQAEFAGEDFEENILYFNKKLKYEKAVLRIRKVLDDTILTFKKRIENELAVKKQIEFETKVEDAEALKNIIENLGLQPALVYEKRRRKWKFRNTEVVLDELPFGLFMEIEGGKNDIAQVEMMLEADGFTVEHETYPQLTQKLGRRNGKIIEARFTENS